MNAQLEKMLDDAERYVHLRKVGSKEELTSIFDLRDAEGKSTIVFTPFIGDTMKEVDTCKDVVAHHIRRLIEKKKITHYAFITEAWAIIRAKYIPGVSTRPAEAEDRKEIILAFATDGKVHLSSSWSIKRDGPICTALIPKEIKQVRIHESGGRFDNLF
jgi:hypothetical protein